MKHSRIQNAVNARKVFKGTRLPPAKFMELIDADKIPETFISGGQMVVHSCNMGLTFKVLYKSLGCIRQMHKNEGFQDFGNYYFLSVECLTRNTNGFVAFISQYFRSS